jgi:hypothetical protein
MQRTRENEISRRPLSCDDLRELYVEKLAASARPAWADAWMLQFDAGVAELKEFRPL